MGYDDRFNGKPIINQEPLRKAPRQSSHTLDMGYWNMEDTKPVRHFKTQKLVPLEVE